MKQPRWMVVALLTLCAAVATAADGDFTFVVLGDRTGGHQEGVYGRVVEAALGEGADLYLTVGDQIEGYSANLDRVRNEWTEYLGIVEALDGPLYQTPGNHDIWDGASEELWREVTGREPNYSFDHAGAHFVVLDTSRLDNPAELPLETLTWLEDDLDAHREAQPTIVLYHKPLWYNFVAVGRDDPLHELLVDYGVDAVFCGHYHTYAADVIDGITYTMVGSSGGRMWDDIPEHGHFYHYVVGRVGDGGLELEVVPLEHAGRWEHGYLSAAEVHLFDDIRRGTFSFEPVFVGERPGGESVDFELTVTNPVDDPIDGELTWDSRGDWSVEPGGVEVELEPGASRSFAFTAELAPGGAFYPLPWVELPVPYRADRAFRLGSYPRILRTEVARPLVEPLVDGVIDELEWLGAGVTESFACDQGGPSDAEQTRFYWGYGPEHLYVAAECRQQDPDSIVARAAERDGAVYYDDCVGLFLAPAGPAEDVYQLYLSIRDVVFDQRIFPTDGGLDADADWNADFRHATAYEDGVWGAELAIPFSELGVEAPTPGDAWRVNFRRKQMAAGAVADWQFPIDYDAAGFGRLLFLGAEAVD